MSKVEDFEKLLKSAVGAKRLSQTKVESLTKLALANMQYDTQLVSTLYRTHKSLSTESKVPSLYVFDSLSRAARSQVNKTQADPHSAQGNCATFLLKVEGVLDGLIQDMMATGTAESKEKTTKVLDIWTKGNTFPPATLTRLREYTNADKSNTNQLTNGATPPVDPRRPPSQQTNGTPASAHATPTPTPTTDASALLALLAQAQGAAASIAPSIPAPIPVPIPTPANSHGTTSPLDPAHLALLQQLAGGLGSTSAPNPPSDPRLQSAGPSSYSQERSYGQGPSSYSQRAPPPPRGRYDDDYDRSPRRDFRYDDRDRDPRRGGGRGGYPDRRGSDREYGRGGPPPRRDWDDRDRRRRSRSPPGPRRDRYEPPPFSPRRRDTEMRNGEVGKSTDPDVDEFGREIRRSAEDDKGSKSPSVPPKSSEPPAPAATTSATPDSGVSAAPPQSSATAPADIVPLNQFDFTTFDFAQPSSWEKLGNSWQVSYGRMPTQDELMSFVMMSSGMMGMMFNGGGSWGNGGGAATNDQPYSSGHSDTNSDGGVQVLAGGNADTSTTETLSSAPTVASNTTGDPPQSPTTDTGGTRRGGKMIKVGDKWQWVKAT